MTPHARGAKLKPIPLSEDTPLGGAEMCRDCQVRGTGE
jgi:hypothetical protein